MANIKRIPREQFVAAIAAERYGDVFASETRQQIGRNQRWIAKRFIHPRTDLAHKICSEVCAQTLLVVIGTQKFGNGARVKRFIERRFCKRNRKRLNWFRRGAYGKRSHSG